MCIIPRILEKVVYKQLETHLIQHNLLYQFQSDLVIGLARALAPSLMNRAVILYIHVLLKVLR
jgi:hypothetical protein